MENNEIAPAPVQSAEELFAKMDMLLSATRQWTLNDNDELGAVIYRRTNEIQEDALVLRDHPDLWEAFSAKAVRLNLEFRRKTWTNLSALNSLN